jgi:hypothetical protein
MLRGDGDETFGDGGGGGGGDGGGGRRRCRPRCRLRDGGGVSAAADSCCGCCCCGCCCCCRANFSPGTRCSIPPPVPPPRVRVRVRVPVLVLVLRPPPVGVESPAPGYVAVRIGGIVRSPSVPRNALARPGRSPAAVAGGRGSAVRRVTEAVPPRVRGGGEDVLEGNPIPQDRPGGDGRHEANVQDQHGLPPHPPPADGAGEGTPRQQRRGRDHRWSARMIATMETTTTTTTAIATGPSNDHAAAAVDGKRDVTHDNPSAQNYPII